jgi:hypothetical protein
MRKLIISLTAIGLATGTAPALATAPCHDAHGKFVKCPKAAPPKATRCKTADGKFAKCGTKGAKPV